MVAADLEAICSLIAEDSPEYAQVFAQRIFGKTEAVQVFPRVGRVIPEYSNESLISHGARKLPDSLE